MARGPLARREIMAATHGQGDHVPVEMRMLIVTIEALHVGEHVVKNDKVWRGAKIAENSCLSP